MIHCIIIKKPKPKSLPRGGKGRKAMTNSYYIHFDTEQPFLQITTATNSIQRCEIWYFQIG